MQNPDQFQPIRPLSGVLIDRIAAGEVLDGPWSAVKELTENSLDAGATEIRIETGGAGLDYIIIEDNGHGIRYEELELALQKHATSKIRDIEDISHILSFGFRGEALSSVASVSHLTLRSLRKGALTGGRIESRGGTVLSREPGPEKQGTIIEVRELFYATPVRKKFLKTERGENQKIARTVLQFALAWPEVRFIYVRDFKEFYNFPPVKDSLRRWTEVYGSETEKKMIPVDFEREGLQITGFISVPEYFKSSRDAQFTWVNRRSVEIRNLPAIVRRCYGESLPHGAHPHFMLFFTIDPERIDVNVHPGKKEIRFTDESGLQGAVIRAVSDALKRSGPVSFENVKQIQQESFYYTPNASPQFFTGMKTGENSKVWEIRSSGEPVHTADSPDGKNNNAPDLRDSRFLPRRHFGIIFGTYVLAESDDAFYIIDQHTAHERINFEKIKKNIENRKGERQALLTPLHIRLSREDTERLSEKQNLLLENGFLTEEFGRDSLILREVPFYVDAGMEEEVFLHLADRIIDGETGLDLYRDYAALRACRTSVKRNDYISGESLSLMLEELSRCEEPARCPHGRPTMIRLTKEDLDRMFLRI